MRPRMRLHLQLQKFLVRHLYRVLADLKEWPYSHSVEDCLLCNHPSTSDGFGLPAQMLLAGVRVGASLGGDLRGLAGAACKPSSR